MRDNTNPATAILQTTSNAIVIDTRAKDRSRVVLHTGDARSICFNRFTGQQMLIEEGTDALVIDYGTGKKMHKFALENPHATMKGAAMCGTCVVLASSAFSIRVRDLVFI